MYILFGRVYNCLACMFKTRLSWSTLGMLKDLEVAIPISYHAVYTSSLNSSWNHLWFHCFNMIFFFLFELDCKLQADSWNIPPTEMIGYRHFLIEIIIVSKHNFWCPILLHKSHRLTTWKWWKQLCWQNANEGRPLEADDGVPTLVKTTVTPSKCRRLMFT